MIAKKNGDLAKLKIAALIIRRVIVDFVKLDRKKMFFMYLDEISPYICAVKTDFVKQVVSSHVYVEFFKTVF